MSNYNKGFFLSTLLNTVCFCRTFTAALTLFKIIFKCVQVPTPFVTSSTELKSLELRLFLNTIKNRLLSSPQPLGHSRTGHIQTYSHLFYSTTVRVTLLESCAKNHFDFIKEWCRNLYCHMYLGLPNQGCRPQDVLLVLSPPVCW